MADHQAGLAVPFGKRLPKGSVWIFSLLFSLWLSVPAAAQEDPVQRAPGPDRVDTLAADSVPPIRYRVNRAYLKSYWTDFKGVASAPFHWKGKNWATFAAIAGTAGVLMLGPDEPIKDFLQRNRNPFLDEAAEVVYPLGNKFPPVLLAGMYVAGVVSGNRRLEHSSLRVAKSLAIATAFYTSTKVLIRRQRPVRANHPRQFTAPFNKNDYTSLPSGHANTAFAVATAFALEYREHKWVPWVAYSLATMTGLSRMYQNRHWTSDVILGSAIGHFVTRTVYRLEEQRHRQRSVPRPVY
ncbi:MAG TPA: phosphatase PAP2 family protein [Chitinophagaceae bacterium]|nr:phosphatase PAP2 family protein [Chitinophagaceae bacterium]